MKTCDILFSQEKEKDVKKRDDQINKKKLFSNICSSFLLDNSVKK